MACGAGLRSGMPQSTVSPYFFPSTRESAQLPSTLQFHALLHARPRADTLAPGGDISEARAVDQRLAPGVDRVEAEIGDGDLASGKIGGVGELIVGGTELGDEAVLVKFDRRRRHLLRHAVAKKE